MNSKVETFLGWLLILGLPALGVFAFLIVCAHDTWVKGKQVDFDRAKGDLFAAVDDTSFSAAQGTKWYRYFEIYAATNEPFLNGAKYRLAFFTREQYSFAGQGRLAITKDRHFLWLDDRRGAKLIEPNYKVPGWRIGF